MTVLATSAHTYWAIALVIGLVSALVAAGLLVMLVNTVGKIDNSVATLLGAAGDVDDRSGIAGSQSRPERTGDP